MGSLPDVCLCACVCERTHKELKKITGSLNEPKSDEVFFVVEKGDTTKKNHCVPIPKLSALYNIQICNECVLNHMMLK